MQLRNRMILKNPPDWPFKELSSKKKLQPSGQLRKGGVFGCTSLRPQVLNFLLLQLPIEDRLVSVGAEKSSFYSEGSITWDTAEAWPLITLSGGLAMMAEKLKNRGGTTTKAAQKCLHHRHVWAVERPAASQTSGSWNVSSWLIWLLNPNMKWMWGRQENICYFNKTKVKTRLSKIRSVMSHSWWWRPLKMHWLDYF